MEEFWKKKPEMLEGIMERRSVRKYLDDPISEEDIRKILLAGHYAPNASNLQTWEFIAVTDRDLNKELALMVDDIYRNMIDLLDDKEAKKHLKYSRFYATFFKDAPLVVYMIAKPYESSTDQYYDMLGEKGAAYRKNRKSADSGLQSIAAAVDNMLLAAWSLGIGGVWMTAPVVAKDKIEQRLEVKGGRLAAVVSMGYPAEPPREANRKPLNEVVRYYR
jgi:nitroreductase